MCNSIGHSQTIESVSEYFVPNIHWTFLLKGEVGAAMIDLANHKLARNIPRLKLHEFLKWATNDQCEPIIKLFNVVNKRGISNLMNHQHYSNEL